MKICKDCKHYKEKNGTHIYGTNDCHSPNNGIDLVTGVLQTRDAKMNRYNLETIGCGMEGKWFEPKFEMDDDEHIASVFCRGGA
jgi:hypothetical protein